MEEPEPDLLELEVEGPDGVVALEFYRVAGGARDGVGFLKESGPDAFEGIETVPRTEEYSAWVEPGSRQASR